MRLNKLSILLVPLMCLSLISCGANEVDDCKELSTLIQKEYKSFVEEAKESKYVESLESVVTVLSFIVDEAANTITTNLGSGFIYDEDDSYHYIITNQHVIRSGTYFKSISATGQVKDATVLGSDGIFDVALIRVEKFNNVKVVKFPNDDYTKIENPEIGSDVYLIGNPATIQNMGTIHFGIVSKVDVDPYEYSSTFENADFAIQANVSMSPGVSGGPLFNNNGEVVGINTYKAETVNGNVYDGINCSLPIQDALLIVDKIRKEGQFVRATVGYNSYIDTKFLTLSEKTYLGLESNYSKGVLVKAFGYNNILNVSKYSIIIKVNDVEVNSKAELRRQLYFAGPNSDVKFTYYEYKDCYDFYEKNIVVKTKTVTV